MRVSTDVSRPPPLVAAVVLAAVLVQGCGGGSDDGGRFVPNVPKIRKVDGKSPSEAFHQNDRKR